MTTIEIGDYTITFGGRIRAMETDPTEVPAEEPATPEVPDGEDAPSETPQVEPATEEGEEDEKQDQQVG